MDEAVRQEIEKLRQAKVKVLKRRYRELFGEESPSCNQQHLFRRIAWRLQERVSGSLSEQARQRAAELADDADLRYRAPHSFWRELSTKGAVDARRRDPRLPPVGSELTRVYQGRPIVVGVQEGGFTYNGQPYGSLSAIAYRVTGTRWNGYAFFGLQPVEHNG